MLPSAHNEPNQGIERVRHALRASGIKKETYNPLRSGVHTRGYLPHVKREGASYFATFRLADALPKEVLLKFEREKAERVRLLTEAQRQGWPIKDSEKEISLDLQRKIERYLDQGCGACYLRKPEIGELVSRAIMHFAGERYLLGNWVVMPNHVHVVVQPAQNHVLSLILKSWKQFTARRAKELLHLGPEPFWQTESFDHWIRDDTERDRISRYIRNNPVVARLCSRPEDWHWSSACPIWTGAVAQTSESAVSQASKPADSP